MNNWILLKREIDTAGWVYETYFEEGGQTGSTWTTCRPPTPLSIKMAPQPEGEDIVVTVATPGVIFEDSGE